MGSIHQTAASALNKKDELHRGTALYRTILKDIYNFNQNEISKVVDENGEPLIVHHGTSHKFNEFKKEYIGLTMGNSHTIVKLRLRKV